MAGLFGGGSQTTVNEENKIAGFQVNSSTYGLPVPVVFGTTRIAGNIIDWFDFTAIPHETRQEQSGGKGGGGITTVNISYTYTVGVLIGLCEGQIAGIGRVWKDKEQFASLSPLGLTLFTGALKQAPWSYVQSVHPERALPYSGLAYVAGVFDLGGSGSLPTLNFEVRGLLLASGDGIDANPADVCEFILSDSLNGINFGSSAIDADGLDRFRDYAYAADLLVSVPATEQKKPAELLKNLCDAVKVQHFWSADRLKFVPRCDETLTRGAVTYTPVTTPEYDLDENDFLAQSDGALVKFSRVESAEAYNHVPVEFLNRANEYQKELADGRVDVDINARGLRSATTKTIHYLHTKARAEYAAQLQVMEYLYGRNKYTFALGWSHCLLEPGDFVTLTDAAIGLDKQPVIIDSVEEDDKGKLSVTAYGRQPGIYNPARYSTQAADRPSVDYNADPGDPINPVVFELPAVISGGVMKAFVAVAGGSAWGGCNVWISSDDTTYKKVATATNPSRYGSLRDALPAGQPVDTVNTLKIDVADSGAVLSSATQADADGKRTLCWVDGELIAYQTATLLDDDHYDLTYLVRGCYGTPITEHAAGSRFVRIDPAVLVGYQYSGEDIGKDIYIKLTSFNVYGINEQTLDAVTPIQHTISNLNPPDVAVLMVEQLANGRRRFVWDYKYPNPNDVTGFRLKYHVGASFNWSDGIPLHDGYVPQSPFETDSLRTGVYTVMIKAVDSAGNESSGTAYAVLGVGEELVENVLLETDCKANGFIGTKTHCSVDGGGNLCADSDGAGGFLAMVYEESFSVAEACQLMMQADIAGDAVMAVLCEFPDAMYPADEDPMYPVDDSLPMYRQNTLYSRYTSKVNVAVNSYTVRVEVADGPVQGCIRALKIIQDVPDIVEHFDDLAISAAGTRLPITKDYRKILRVYAPVQGGGTAVGWIVADKDTALGPLIYLVDGSGTPVTGVVDATVQGY